jgi:predicted transcriptional regulator of viral defense system
MAQSHREASQRLFEYALEQQGFFTTKQAKDAGFAENTHPYHVKAGNWIREHRGIYRLAQFPPADRPDLVLWALWSRNRREEVQGVFSHQTALSLHELSDVNPAKIHMTVPETFRKNSEIPNVLVLHYGELADSDVESASGYRFTRPLRTILDVIASGDLERSTITQGVRQAFERGLVTRSQVRSTPMSDAERKLIGGALRRVA